MNVTNTSVATFGSAAIASPPTDANVKRDDQPAQPSPAQQIIEASKPEGTGQFVDKKV